MFKTSQEHFQQPPIFFKIDTEVFIESFRFALYKTPIAGSKVLINSLLAASLSAVIAVLLGASAAYAFARFKTGGGNLPFFILTLRMAPPIAIGLPYFLVFRTLKLLDTVPGLIIAYVGMNLPLVIWLLRSFFGDMNPEVEEAALVDGANYLQVLRYVTLPLAAPAIVATLLLAFIASWNEFFFAILLTRVDAPTLPTLLPFFTPREMGGQGPWASAFILANLSVLPVVILALFLQRYMVRGLSLGAVK
jgi:multiple sugar transport system permease protein